jgi:hypothetical protein
MTSSVTRHLAITMVLAIFVTLVRAWWLMLVAPLALLPENQPWGALGMAVGLSPILTSGLLFVAALRARARAAGALRLLRVGYLVAIADAALWLVVGAIVLPLAAPDALSQDYTFCIAFPATVMSVVRIVWSVGTIGYFVVAYRAMGRPENARSFEAQPS